MTVHKVSLSTMRNVHADNGKDDDRRLQITYPASLFKVQIQVNVKLQLTVTKRHMLPWETVLPSHTRPTVASGHTIQFWF